MGEGGAGTGVWEDEWVVLAGQGGGGYCSHTCSEFKFSQLFPDSVI